MTSQVIREEMKHTDGLILEGWTLHGHDISSPVVSRQKELSQIMIPSQKWPDNTWAREQGIEWVYDIPYSAPASGKVKQ